MFILLILIDGMSVYMVSASSCSDLYESYTIGICNSLKKVKQIIREFIKEFKGIGNYYFSVFKWKINKYDSYIDIGYFKYIERKKEF